MNKKVNPSLLARYQILGTVILFFVLVGSIGLYFYRTERTNGETRLKELEYAFIQQLKSSLESDVDSILKIAQYDSQNTRRLLKEAIQHEVDKAHGIAESLYNSASQQFSPKSLSEIELKTLIKESFRQYRFFDGRGYIFISNLAGESVLLPTSPQIEGTSVKGLIDDTGLNITEATVQAVRTPEQSGFVEYRWYPPGNKDRMRDKISYVRLFEPFDWIFGSGDYVYQMTNDLKKRFIHRATSTTLSNGRTIYLMDKEGRFLVAPDSQVQLDVALEETKSSYQKYLAATLLTESELGGGFININDAEGSGQIVLIKMIDKWDWIIAAGINPKNSEAIINGQRKSLIDKLEENFRNILVAFISAGFLTLILTLVFSRWIKGVLESYLNENEIQQKKLVKNAKDLVLAAGVFDSITQGVLITDNHFLVVKANKAYIDACKFNVQEIQGKKPLFLTSGINRQTMAAEISGTLKRNKSWQGEAVQKTKLGETFPSWVSITIIQNDQGRIQNYIFTIRDITERKKTEDQLRYLADYDSLTDLPNRRFLTRHVDHLLQTCEAESLVGAVEKKYQFAIVFMDLDNFKDVNDSLGHSYGDKVLVAVSKRLKGAVRSSDIMVRLGGDEFVMIFSPCPSITHINTYCRRLIEVISQPLNVESEQLTLTTSLGIALYPGDGTSTEDLIRNADTALYESKRKGRNNFTYFDRSLTSKAAAKFKLDNDLRTAIRNQAFEAVFQPQIMLEDDSMCGVEALIRWRDQEGNYISPAEFIPHAEQLGLISKITDWMLYRAAHQAKLWHETLGIWLPISVNLSAVDINENLLKRLSQLQVDTGIGPEGIELEVTESGLISNLDLAIDTLARVKDMGFSIALDDFGTGYSSLRYLSRFPIDKIKIDKSFIDHITEPGKGIAITESIISVAHNLGMRTIAEGVETQGQKLLLKKLGCQCAQGYYFSKPVTADSVLDYLHDNHAMQVTVDKV